MINDSNYELWLLRYAEQELTAEESVAVEQWLATHPEAAEELALYNEAPRLEKDESVHYGAVMPHCTMPLWPTVLRWSAAAAVVAALMVPVARLSMDKQPEEVALQVATVQEERIAEEIKKVDDEEQQGDRRVLPIKVDEGTPVLAVEETPVLVAEEALDMKETVAKEKTVVDVIATELSVEYCDNLISYELPPDTIYTNTLVYYDESRRSWTEDLKVWATETKLAQWVGRRIKARENELFALNGE